MPLLVLRVFFREGIKLRPLVKASELRGVDQDRDHLGTEAAGIIGELEELVDVVCEKEAPEYPIVNAPILNVQFLSLDECLSSFGMPPQLVETHTAIEPACIDRRICIDDLTNHWQSFNPAFLVSQGFVSLENVRHDFLGITSKAHPSTVVSESRLRKTVGFRRQLCQRILLGHGGLGAAACSRVRVSMGAVDATQGRDGALGNTAEVLAPCRRET